MTDTFENDIPHGTVLELIREWVHRDPEHRSYKVQCLKEQLEEEFCLDCYSYTKGEICHCMNDE